MDILSEPLPGAYLIQPKVFRDLRGEFVKTYHAGRFTELGLPFTPAEEFISTSRRGVLRGMHFQLPPFDHAKVVYCLRGRVIDVLLDLRRDSPRFGTAQSFELSGANRLQVFIPPGLAHGFLALEDDTMMAYQTSTVHDPSHDAGVRWDSIGFEWGIGEPIMSERDRAFPPLAAFQSPF